MTPGRQRILIGAALALLAASAALSNTVLFRQVVQGRTELTRGIASRIGAWQLIDEQPASASEVQGLETSDIIKRTYSDGRDYMELVVAYIAHSSRKSAHAQEACLRDWQCDVMQGFGYARPVPVAEATAFMESCGREAAIGTGMAA